MWVEKDQSPDSFWKTLLSGIFELFRLNRLYPRKRNGGFIFRTSFNTNIHHTKVEHPGVRKYKNFWAFLTSVWFAGMAFSKNDIHDFVWKVGAAGTLNAGIVMRRKLG